MTTRSYGHFVFTSHWESARGFFTRRLFQRIFHGVAWLETDGMPWQSKYSGHPGFPKLFRTLGRNGDDISFSLLRHRALVITHFVTIELVLFLSSQSSGLMDVSKYIIGKKLKINFATLLSFDSVNACNNCPSSFWISRFRDFTFV